jgi:hypothetical protein
MPHLLYEYGMFEIKQAISKRRLTICLFNKDKSKQKKSKTKNLK